MQKYKLISVFLRYNCISNFKSTKMLLQFTVKNYKVFGDEVKLNMIANSDDTRESENVISLPKFGLRVLKSAVMYGANASGKSKLVEAMQFMKHFILKLLLNLTTFYFLGITILNFLTFFIQYFKEF